MLQLKSLEILVHSGQLLDPGNIEMTARKGAKDKDFVMTAYAEGKEVAQKGATARM
jgi:hypothetical protein